jgi:drug/metabolite transporter (DMT)-like permease
MSRRGWLLFLAMGVIWGIPYLLIKVAIGSLTPPTLVFFRTALGAVILVPLAAARGELKPLRAHWRWVMAYTIVEVSLPWLLLADAERHLSSSLTGLLIAAVPIVGALLAWALRADDRPPARRVVGLVVGFTGCAALLGLDPGRGSLGAVGEVALVAVGYATGPAIISRKLSDLPAVGVVAVSLALTAAIYAPLGLAQAPHRLPSVSVLASVALLGVVCTALAFVVFFALISEVGPLRATVITYVNPAVALALGVVLLREAVTAGALVGFALILVGSFLTTRRPAATGAPPPGQVIPAA